MLFNSYLFILAFLPISFFIYFFLSQRQKNLQAKIFLILSSLFFYAWWNPVYLPIILASVLFNYSVGKWISRSEDTRRKPLLLFGILSNVTLLGYFKYSDFLLENLSLLTGKEFPLLNLTLPLAISFFTFQQIAYLVDSYRGETGKYTLLDYMLFITFFPQLIAGPIVYHREMMPQFNADGNRRINYRNIAIGLFIFSVGLFKKTVLADTFAYWATRGFDLSTQLNMLEGWASSLSYTFQLYFDFSGYTDMAIGAALLFNIRLPVNFNSPYRATNIRDFWRRWHITLSRFLKDYIYIPLGGSRRNIGQTYRNLLITFLIAGIWHGAGWTFVFWGFLHGAAMVLHRIWNRMGLKLWPWLAWLVTFNFINITWIFFRAKEWEDALKVLQAMFDPSRLVLPSSLSNRLSVLQEYGIKFGAYLKGVNGGIDTILWIAIGFFITLGLQNIHQRLDYPRLTTPDSVLTPANALRYSLIFSTGLLAISISRYTEFIYFNF